MLLLKYLDIFLNYLLLIKNYLNSLDKDYNHKYLRAMNGVLDDKKVCQKFAKVYYFFDSQENTEKENARIMWKNFVTQNVVCKYWVNKANKWVLENSS